METHADVVPALFGEIEARDMQWDTTPFCMCLFACSTCALIEAQTSTRFQSGVLSATIVEPDIC